MPRLYWNKGLSIVGILLAMQFIFAENNAVILGQDAETEVLDSPLYRWEKNKSETYEFSNQVTIDKVTLKAAGNVVYTPAGMKDRFGESTKQEQATATAFVVSNQGHVITCAHVIEGAVKVTLRFGDEVHEAKILAMDEADDLALLQIDSGSRNSLSLAATGKVQLAQDVRVVGYPLSDVLGNSIKVTRGTVAGFIGTASDRRFQLDAPINSGNSGGPVVNDFGQVIGVASAKLAGNEISNVGFAVPVAKVVEFLKQQQVVLDTSGSQPATALSGPEIAQQVTPAVGFVEVQLGAGGYGLKPMMELKFFCNYVQDVPQRPTTVMGGRSPFGGGLGRHPMFGGGFGRPQVPRQLRFIKQNRKLSGTVRVAPDGVHHGLTEDQNSLYGLRPLALTAVLPLSGEDKEWTFSQPIVIASKTKDKQSLLQLAVEEFQYTWKETTDKDFVISFDYQLLSEGKDNESANGAEKRLPKIEGRGTILFDRHVGLPRKLDFEGIAREVSEGKPIVLKLKESFLRVDKELLKQRREAEAKRKEKMEADRLAAIEAAKPKPVSSERIDELLAELRDSNFVKQRDALRALKLAIPNERREDVVQALKDLGEDVIFGEYPQAALLVWADESYQDEAVKLLDKNVRLRTEAEQYFKRYPCLSAAETLMSRNRWDTTDQEVIMALGPYLVEVIEENPGYLLGARRPEKLLAILQKHGRPETIPALTKLLVKPRIGDNVPPIIREIEERFDIPEEQRVEIDKLRETAEVRKEFFDGSIITSYNAPLRNSDLVYEGQYFVALLGPWLRPVRVEEVTDAGVRVVELGRVHSDSKVVSRSDLHRAPPEIDQPPPPISLYAVIDLRKLLMAVLFHDQETAGQMLKPGRSVGSLFAGTKPPAWTREILQAGVNRLTIRLPEVGEAIDLPGGRTIRLTDSHVNDQQLMLIIEGHPMPYLAFLEDEQWKFDGRSFAANNRAAADSP